MAWGARAGFEPAAGREPPTAGLEPAALPALRPGGAAHARSAFPPGGGAEAREGAEGEPAPGHGHRDFGLPGAQRCPEVQGSAAVRAQCVPRPPESSRALAVSCGS